MTSKWNDALFKRWVALREDHRNAIKEKNYQSIVDIGNEILELDKKAPFIQILTSRFENDIAETYAKLGDIKMALEFYHRAVESLELHRATKDLNRPDDFLSQIESLREKITKLESKQPQ